MSDTANHTGVMIALFLPTEAAQNLYRQVAPILIAAGLTPALPEEYHVTLIYLGDSSEPEVANNLVTASISLESLLMDGLPEARPIAGHIGGIGRFFSAYEDSEDALYASVDAVDLPHIREAIYQDMRAVGALPPQSHGFSPHITLAYMPLDLPTPDIRLPAIDVTFDTVTLALGDDHLKFPLNSGAKAGSDAMPYMINEDKGQYCVYKKGADGKPEGSALGKHKTRGDAEDQVKALYASEGDKAKKEDWGGSLAVEPTGMPDWMKLAQNDKRVLYDAIGGLKGGKACANCQWFNKDNTCQIVVGPIVATGLSSLWLEQPTYEQEPLPVVIVDQGSAERKSLLDQVKSLLVGRKQDEAMGIKVLPDHRWIAYWTNNFEDKEGEIFTEAAHDDYIARVDGGRVPMPELWYWHVAGTRHGQAEWLGRVEHINVAVGTFDPTPAGQAFERYYASRKAGPHRVSHGYLYPVAMKQNGVYHAYTTFEISPLPAGREANAITGFSSVQEISMPISDEKRQALEAILGKDLAAKTLGDAAQQSKAAEDLGLKFKDATGPIQAIDTEAREAVKAIAEVHAQDAEGIKALNTKLDQLLTAVKAVQDGEAARNARMTQLEQGVKAAFELQPSPRQAPATVIPANNPLLLALQDKQLGGEEPPRGIFDMFLNAAKNQGGQ